MSSEKGGRELSEMLMFDGEGGGGRGAGGGMKTLGCFTLG